MTIYDLKTMQICDIRESTVVALGFFDGCHAGHQAVVASCRALAHKMGAKSAVYTFSSLPKSEDTKCMCKEFREQIADPDFKGYCHCMLYYKD